MRELTSKTSRVTSLLVILLTMMGLVSTIVFAAEGDIRPHSGLEVLGHGEWVGGKWHGTLNAYYYPDGPDLEVYCDSYEKSLSPLSHSPGGSVLPKVAWILSNYYPVEPDQPNSGLDENRKARCVQEAIWEFTNPGVFTVTTACEATGIVAAAEDAKWCDSLELKPASATNVVPEADWPATHTVTATLLAQDDSPISGETVTFTVTGENADASGTCSPNADCTTDANGEVSFTYTGNNAGSDTITATVDCKKPGALRWEYDTDHQGLIKGDPQPLSAEASKEWVYQPTAVTLSSFAARSSVGGSASPLWLGLVGLMVLASGSLFRTKRQAG